MSTKAEMIQEMLEMQKKFIEHEQSGQFEAEDYFIGSWKDYREKYQTLANQVREIASEEAGFWK